MRYTLGIDLGSSGMKITYLGEDGRSIGPFSAEIPTIFPEPGWAEQNPDGWYDIFLELFAAATRASGISPGDICALAVDAATHTTVILDKNFHPLRNAIMWNDQRSHKVASCCQALYGEEILAKTYHAPSAMWSLCQLLWVREQEPHIWKQARHLLFAKDYLRLRMGGRYVTDYIDAEGSQLFHMETKKWDEHLCSLLKQDILFPEILDPLDQAGQISTDCARATGLTEGTPIYAGASDTVMEVLAAGAIHPDDATLKLATSGRICVITDRAYPHPLLVNYSHVIPGLWYPGSGTRSCATSLRWFKDQFCRQEQALAREADCSVYQLLDKAAQQIQPGCEGLIYHPYLLGEFTPYQDPDLRASFTGASMKHTHGHFVRSVMEGCAFSLLDSYKKLCELGIPQPESFLLIGGGASSKVWSQIVADVLQMPMRKPAISDSSFGSSQLAAVAHGIFRDFQEANHLCAGDFTLIEPNPGNRQLYQEYFHIYKDIQRSLAPIYSQLARLSSADAQ